jgi:soluble lytic murein transglycosylase-like protein
VRRLVLTAVAALAALALAPAAVGLNPQVAGLQIALRQHGLYRGPIDGLQGPKTARAVRAFQRRHRLTADGLAGPRTRAALGARGQPLFGARVIRRGMRGYDVGVLQFLLRYRGLRPGRLDGSFGARTEAALRRFQRRNRLTPDGVVGPRTARRLCALRSCTWRARVARHTRSKPALKHRIAAGETLTTIARRYGVTVEAIARANRLDPSGYILAGARIRIPRASMRAIGTSSSAVREAIDHWSAVYGVDGRLVRALAWWESGFNNSKVSSAGARGVMQVTPATWAYVEMVLVGHRIPHTASGNVQVGVVFLNQLLREFHGNVRLALAGYAQGPRSVRRHGLFRETRHYVRGVLAVRSRLS